MKSMLIYQTDADDPSELDIRIAERIETLFLDEIAPEERPEDKRIKPHEGIKAIRAIKTNGFTPQQVDAFRRYADILIGRRERRISAVLAEKKAAPRDEMSLRAYDHVIQSMQQGVAEARRLVAGFVDAFQSLRAA